MNFYSELAIQLNSGDVDDVFQCMQDTAFAVVQAGLLNKKKLNKANISPKKRAFLVARAMIGWHGLRGMVDSLEKLTPGALTEADIITALTSRNKGAGQPDRNPDDETLALLIVALQADKPHYNIHQYVQFQTVPE